MARHAISANQSMQRQRWGYKDNDQSDDGNGNGNGNGYDDEEEQQPFLSSSSRSGAMAMAMTVGSRSTQAQRQDASELEVATSNTTHPDGFITVMAPANLPQGCQFPARSMDGKMFMAKVPPGGCKAGQMIQVPLPSTGECIKPKFRPPHGDWKDGIFDVFQHGMFHPSVWVPCCCVLVAIGQVMERLQSSSSSSSSNDRNNSRNTHSNALCIITIITNIIRSTIYSQVLGFRNFWLFPIVHPAERNLAVLPDTAMLFWRIDQAIVSLYMVLAMFLVWRVRKRIRRDCSIPTQTRLGCTEDALTAICCPSLAVAQALRHTTDYERLDAAWCSSTGLSHEGGGELVM
mmetsp:Transcript_7657/g.22276  ORF Transcript_7657/g.22276 Transcript_7657/m.22276 type:complete len:346 (-) Transcript_7657:96-1133(-)